MLSDIPLLSGHSAARDMGAGGRLQDWVSFLVPWHRKRHPMMAATPFDTPGGYRSASLSPAAKAATPTQAGANPK